MPNKNDELEDNENSKENETQDSESNEQGENQEGNEHINGVEDLESSEGTSSDGGVDEEYSTSHPYAQDDTSVDFSEFEESQYDDDFYENREAKKRRPKSFLVELFSKIENFNIKDFMGTREEKREEKKEKVQKKKKLKDSEKTINDIQKQRSSYLRNLLYKFGLVVFIFILITVAFIMAFQDNEQLERRYIDTKKLMNDSTSFGGIDQKDYFLEQNVLDDKINAVEKKSEHFSTMQQMPQKYHCKKKL